MERTYQFKTALIAVLMLLAVSFINAQALSGSISNQTNATCFGYCDGSLTATASGGTGGPYTYNWSNGAAGQLANGLCAGSYTCTIGDGVSTFTIAATITEPAQINATASNTGPYCTGGTIQLNATGGTTYSWAGPAGFTSTAANPTIAGAISAHSGVYTVTVTAGSCTATASTTVTVNANPTPTASNTGPYCVGATIQLNATGGTTYNWSGPNAFSSTSANPTIAASTTAMSGLYTVTVVVSGCTATASTTVTVNSMNLSVSAVNTTCNGACDGTTSVIVSGGTPPYQYQWNTNPVQNTATATGLCAGTYTISVTDNNTCVSANTVTVMQPPPLTASVASQTNASCFGVCDGSATIGVSGGTAPYSFSWMPTGNTAPTGTGLCAGSYTCSVTDASGCTTQQTVTITQPSQISVSANNQTTCYGTSVVLCASAFGGAGGYSYSWVPASCFSNPAASCATTTCTTSGTTYTVTVTDMTGCISFGVVSVSVTPLPVISVTSHAEPACAASNGTITFTSTAGSSPFLFDITQIGSPNGTGIFSNLTSQTYTLSATDANGCTGADVFVLLDSCEVVWPGDADNDLIANNNDILDIGLYYGSTGGVRPNASISWSPQPAPFWATTKANGFNEKHDDCNGDGIIDATDTTAVIQNYNFTHPPYKLMANSVTGTPLSLEFVQDTISNSGETTVLIMLGSGSFQANNIYGVALTVSIDTSIVEKDSTTLDVSGSWISSGSVPFLNNLIENYNNGEVDIALCRSNHTDVSGSGQIAAMSVTMKDDITGKIMTGVTKTLQMNITRAKIISSTGDTVSFSPAGDSVVVSQLTTSAASEFISKGTQIRLYPNPAEDFAVIKTDHNEISAVEVYTLLGSKVAEGKTEVAVSEVTINTKTLQSGVYIVKVYSSSGPKTFRLQVK